PQVHPVVSRDHCVRSSRTAGAACAQPEPECLCGALGQVGEGGVPVQGDPLWRAFAAASAERICRPFPCRTESPREGQYPALSCACFCECNSQQPNNRNGEVRDALRHQSGRGTPPDEAMSGGNGSLYCFNF